MISLTRNDVYLCEVLCSPEHDFHAALKSSGYSGSLSCEINTFNITAVITIRVKKKCTSRNGTTVITGCVIDLSGNEAVKVFLPFGYKGPTGAVSHQKSLNPKRHSHVKVYAEYSVVMRSTTQPVKTVV